MSLFFFAPVFALAIIVFAAVLILRAVAQGFSNSSASLPRSRPNVATQLGDDGFWITSCPADPLAIIHYYYWTAGVRRSGQIPFQPDNEGKQFVYTGDRPEQVSIVRIVEETDDGSPSILPPIIGAADSFWDSSSSSSSSPPAPSSSFSGFPSAY